ncbi:helix-turn-helix domain-containing protein [Epibacterium ulvae]|uniref:helix-turn-helix domain-containing protein n=1 Tax=Epibacterium ulvae TaxID=1156985 RepID=UPI0024910D73|nr:XRE family transcriptional regulator [Epibacterium ulvae]
MARQMLTGSRIRERRMMLGLRQSDLAQRVSISPSYLNLIEHNRRKIGGKLLVDIAEVLGVEPSLLTEGAEATLLSSLREAGADQSNPIAELDRVEEFAGRFPGWAEVLMRSHARIVTLERHVQTLSDRVTHDPQLASSLHEMLSTAAAIRSTADILVDNKDLEESWLDRFHRNLNEDAQRLAESSRELVSFLDENNAQAGGPGLPADEMDRFLSDNGYHFATLETDEETVLEVIENAPQLQSQAARQMAQRLLVQYVNDARFMPLEEMLAAVAEFGIQPDRIQARFGGRIQQVLRRLAWLPEDRLGQEVGLLMCDASGAILLHKPIGGFSAPKFGAACPLWPVYQALGQPHVPLHHVFRQHHGRGDATLESFSYAWQAGEAGFERDPQLRAAMVLVAAPETTKAPIDLGVTCRLCDAERCTARREPSILREGF